MQVVQTEHPPGGVVFISGELPRYGQSMQCLMNLEVPPGSMRAWHMGVMVARSLEQAFRAVMANKDMQWVWLMGDDHTYSPDTLIRLLDRNEPVIAPMCLNRVPPFGPTIHLRDTGGVKPLQDLPTKGVYTLRPNESCGDAGLLIRRPVLEASGPPWYDHAASGALNAEDQQFTQRLGRLGFPVKIDMEVTIGHMTPFDVVPVATESGWDVRLSAGKLHVCDLTMERPQAAPEMVAAE